MTMWLDAALAYLHFTAVFVLFAFLTVEVMLARGDLDARAVRMLARVDLWYVGATAAALATGLARAAWGAKGWSFYAGDWVFHAKVALFLVVAGLAIPPALAILRWNRRAAAEPGFAVAEDERRRLRRYLMWEVHAAALVPVLAVVMARGLAR
jgi:putative membrane protein